MKIDSHQHFWKYNIEEFGWIDDSMSVLRRDFLPGELKEQLDNNGLDGSVAVQARQTIDETDWLLELAEKNQIIKGVVGWIPLVDEKVGGEAADHRCDAGGKRTEKPARGKIGRRVFGRRQTHCDGGRRDGDAGGGDAGD